MNAGIEGLPAAGLLERAEALDRLDALALGATRGESAIAAIVGAPGEGKSSLLAAACAAARSRQMRVCTARGSDLEHDFAFGVVRQLLERDVHLLKGDARERLFEGAAGLAASVFGVDSERLPDSPFAVLHGLYWVLAGLAASRPILLAVDDLHWADDTSVQWLSFLSHRLEGLGVLVVFAARPPGPDSGLLATLAAEPAVTTVSVRPLTSASVEALVERALGVTPDPVFTTACARVTGGNPFAVAELLGELSRRRASPDGATAQTLDGLGPAGFERNVRARLGRLGPRSPDVALALAVLGDGAPLIRVASLAGLSLDRAAVAADALAQAGILDAGSELRFVHPLMRTAVDESIPARRRAALHARAATLLARDASPEAVAAHLLQADPAHDPVSVQILCAAGAAAIGRGAPGAAVRYLERALEERLDADARGRVLGQLGRAEMVARNPLASEHLRAALDATAEPLERARLAADLADTLTWLGGIERDRILALLRGALSDAGERDPDLTLRLEGRLLGTAVALDRGLDPRGEAEVQRLLAHANAHRQRASARPLRLSLGFLMALRASPAEEVMTLIEGGLDPGRPLGDGGEGMAVEGADILAAAQAAWALVLVDRGQAAVDLASQVAAGASRRGSALGLAAGAALCALAQLRRGALAEAESEALTAISLPGELGLDFTGAFASLFLADVWLEQGRLAEAADLVQELPQLTSARITALDVRSRIRLALGEPDAAIEDLRACMRLCEEVGARHPGLAAWRSNLAHALAERESGRARELADSELADAHRTGLPRYVGVALRARAATESGATRVQTLEEAVAALQRSPAPLELARALIDLGGELRRSGSRAQARDPLRRALEVSFRSGAERLGAIAADELRIADGRPRRPLLSGVEALTPAELRVARHAAGGQTNREIAQALFVTTKTVESHLSNIYGKLNIASRKELRSVLPEGADEHAARG